MVRWLKQRSGIPELKFMRNDIIVEKMIRIIEKLQDYIDDID